MIHQKRNRRSKTTDAQKQSAGTYLQNKKERKSEGKELKDFFYVKASLMKKVSHKTT